MGSKEMRLSSSTGIRSILPQPKADRYYPVDNLGAAEGGCDVFHEAMHLLAHKCVGAVAEVEVEDELVDADRFDPLQRVDDLLWRAVKQRVVVEVGSFGVIEPLAHLLEILHCWGQRALATVAHRLAQARHGNVADHPLQCPLTLVLTLADVDEVAAFDFLRRLSRLLANLAIGGHCIAQAAEQDGCRERRQ